MNSQDINLNRDAVRVDTVELTGLYRNVFNRWDPTLIFDAHMMGWVQHATLMDTSTAPYRPRRQFRAITFFDKLFPSVRDAVRANFGLEVFTHSGTDRKWPPTIWGPGEAIWSTDANRGNAYGLRNRCPSAETPGHEKFERRIYAHYA